MTLPERTAGPALSGTRLRAVYGLPGPATAAHGQAGRIAVEQTVEFPAELLPAGPITDEVVGRIEALEPVSGGRYEVTVSYAVELVAGDLTQLLNVVFGNVACHPDVRLERLELTDATALGLPGPRFGSAGLRARLGLGQRPLLASAVKPMGLDVATLAELAYRMARGGIDLIKDDHGLTNPSFSPFEARVHACVDAVARANRETGRNAIYLANVSGPLDQLRPRARMAVEAGVGGLVVSPGLTGLDALRLLAADDRVGVPLFSHPTWLGGMAPHGLAGGIAPYALFGQLLRLAGADASIFIGHGGRFPTRPEDSRAILAGCRDPLGGLPAILPVVGGGTTLEGLPELRRFYGDDVGLLCGGALHREGPDLTATCQRFVELANR